MTDCTKLIERLHDALFDNATLAKAATAIDALKAENGQLHASLQSARVAFEQVCKHRDALQAKLDELQRQEPVGRFVSDDDCGHIDLVPHQGQPMVDGQAVYAAPKALEPVKEHLSYATTVMALIEDYAKAVHDGDDNSCTVLRRTIKASLEQPPKALEPLTDERKYKLLDHGEEIQKGDTVLDDDATTWHPLAGWEVGMKWGCNLMPMRRAIEAAHGITKGTP